MIVDLLRAQASTSSTEVASYSARLAALRVALRCAAREALAVGLPTPGAAAKLGGVFGALVGAWEELKEAEAKVTTAKYTTNFGDTRLKGGDSYTHFRYSVHIHRPVVGYLIKTVLPIAIVILMVVKPF